MSLNKFMPDLLFVRESDFVEYFIFPELPESAKSTKASSSHAAKEDYNIIEQQLLDVRSKCLQMVKELVKERNYIWHKDDFNLTVQIHPKMRHLLVEETVESKRSTRVYADGNEDVLPPHLHGVTHYGENIGDEWFLVFLLLEFTKKFPGCVVRIVDNDGEFMLIEAAEVVPNWVTPDTCAQRVYLYNGFVHLVQNSPSNTRKLMPVASAITKIRINPTLYKVSQSIQQCIDGRLQEFKTTKNTSLHKQIVNVPVNVAALLKRSPLLIAPAVRAFCDHDRIDERLFRKMANFPADKRTRINVDFTHCLYAMLMHNNYQPDPNEWGLLNKSNAEEFKENMLGSKLAFGFEILVEKAKRDCNTAWQGYMRNLKSSGYFADNLEGSPEYNALYKVAKYNFKKNQKQFRTYSVVGDEILQILADLGGQSAVKLDNENKDLTPSDSDDWLNVSPEQLDEMLGRRYAFRKFKECGDKIDAKSFTAEIKEFLNRKSNFEGIEKFSDVDTESDSRSHSDDHSRDVDDDLEEDDDNDYKEDVCAEEKKKISLKQKLFSEDPLDWLYPQKGKPSQLGEKRKEKRRQIGNLKQEIRRLERLANTKIKFDFFSGSDSDSDSDLSDYDEDEQIERNFSKMSESERQHRADFKAYFKKMDDELANTTIGKTFATRTPEANPKSQSKLGDKKDDKDVSPSSSSANKHDDDFDDIENFKPIDINVNTLENMMQSFTCEMGASGPVSNLISAMGEHVNKTTNPTSNNDETVAKDLTESSV